MFVAGLLVAGILQCGVDVAQVDERRRPRAISLLLAQRRSPCFVEQMFRMLRCASGCVVECRICNLEVAGSNLSLGYFAPRSTQPSIPPGSVNEYQLQLGRQRQVWLIPIADERVGVQVRL